MVVMQRGKMKLLTLALLSVLCTLNEAITLKTVATVSMVLLNLNQPASCFFGMFRRRKSPVQETVAPPEMQAPFSFPSQPPMGGGFSPFGMGAGGYFPGFGFGMPGLGGMSGFGANRFPPQMPPSRPGKTPQREMPAGRPPMNMPPQRIPAGMPPMNMPPQHMPAGMPPMNMPPQHMSQEDSKEDAPGMNTEEAESFFTLLAETDESKCISRLVCEMGANPETGGEFGQTIVEIIGNLNDFPDGSKVSEYNEVLTLGMDEGLSACRSKYSICDEESYDLVKKAQLDNE